MAIILLCACQSRESLPAQLRDNTCPVPCWQGLLPGESTEQQVLITLQALPHVATETIAQWVEGEPGFRVTSVSWSSVGADDYNIADMRNGTLVLLRFWVDAETSLDGFILQYGAPETFSVSVDRGGPSLVLDYSTQGMCVTTQYAAYRDWQKDLERGIFRVDGKARLDVVAFFEPMSLQEVLPRAYLVYNATAVENTLAVQQPWQGFCQAHISAWDEKGQVRFPRDIQ